MGDVTDLAAYRARGAARTQAAETAGAPVRAEVYFDLASPFTYLAAERVHRAFGALVWIPGASRVLRRDAAGVERERRAADARAAALRLPLVWPERWPMDVPAAMRAAAHAAAEGRAAEFVIAASRLAWAGGFDLGNPHVIAEAAAAANLLPEASLLAAGDAGLDRGIESAALSIAAAGADRLPAFRVGRAVFDGEDGIAAAAAYARSSARGA